MVDWNKSVYDKTRGLSPLLKLVSEQAKNQAVRLSGLLLLLMLTLTACNLGNPETEEPLVQLPTETTAPQIQITNRADAPPSPTALPVFNTAIPTAILPPTAIIPATATTASPIPNTRLLNNGRGLSTGITVNNGEFQVEGYCGQLNPAYSVHEDGVNWFCTFENQDALQLREQHFTDICQRTYGNPNAFAAQVGTSPQPAYRWRCLEYTIRPTNTPQMVPALLNNGRGLSTGLIMNNGEFQVEGYCSLINPAYSVSEDNINWFCTLNGQPILTLGTAEFDDICIRTYNNPAAYAEQLNLNVDPAFRWRCLALVPMN